MIGSGLAGLTAAHLLSEKYNVTVLERNANVGMDIASVSVSDGSGNEVRIDSPLRGISRHYYPTVFQLYAYLGVNTRAAVSSISISNWEGSHNPRNSLNTFAFDKITSFSLISIVKTLYWFLLLKLQEKIALFEICRIVAHAILLSQTKKMAYVEGTMGDWLERHHFSKSFTEFYLAPYLCSMGTCTVKQLLAYPAKVLLHLLSHPSDRLRIAEGGVRTVCSRLLENVSEVVFDFEVVGVWRDLTTGKIVIVNAGGYRREFDKVVFAGQAILAKKLLTAAPPSNIIAAKPDVRTIMGLAHFLFYPVRTVVHTDETLMPSEKSQWRSGNFLIDSKKETMATLWINELHAPLLSSMHTLLTISKKLL